jgi:hypothetical protein
MCDAAGLKSSLKTTDKSGISGWRFEIAPSGAVVAAGATSRLGAGDRAGQTVTLVWRLSATDDDRQGEGGSAPQLIS